MGSRKRVEPAGLGVRVQRRSLLKKAAVSAVALASAPALGHVLASAAYADKKITFTFAVASQFAGGVFDGDVVLLNGSGHFGSGIEGDGSITHFDGLFGPVLAQGTWKAKKLISFAQEGTQLGAHFAGVLEFEADARIEGQHGKIPISLKQVCDLPGRDAPGDEGVVLTTPSGTASPTGIGATLFSIE